MNAREIKIVNMGGLFKMDRDWLLWLATVLIVGGVIANAQTAQPAEITHLSLETSIEASPSANAQISAEQAQQPASQVNDKPGNIIGTILDQSGSVAAGANVRLTSENRSFSREVVSGGNGQFSFSNVPAGPFKLSVSSTGFGGEAFSGELAPGQTYLVPPIVLSIATVVTAVNVKVDPVEVATEEVKERHEKLSDDVDSILDEIDEVLEENAEEFVRSYVQKGGQ